jgi:hypothetical protein
MPSTTTFTLPLLAPLSRLLGQEICPPHKLTHMHIFLTITHTTAIKSWNTFPWGQLRCILFILYYYSDNNNSSVNKMMHCWLNSQGSTPKAVGFSLYHETHWQLTQPPTQQHSSPPRKVDNKWIWLVSSNLNPCCVQEFIGNVQEDLCFSCHDICTCTLRC